MTESYTFATSNKKKCASCRRPVRSIYISDKRVKFLFNADDAGKLHYCQNNTICSVWPDLFKSSIQFEEWLETETYWRMLEAYKNTGGDWLY